jgi:hypothetical protein
MGKIPVFLIPEAAQPGTPGALGWKRMQKRSRAEANGGYIGSQSKGKTEIRVNNYAQILYNPRSLVCG